MNASASAKHYFELAGAADAPSWRTVYTLGYMCALAVAYGDVVTFDYTGDGDDWPASGGDGSKGRRVQV